MKHTKTLGLALLAAVAVSSTSCDSNRRISNQNKGVLIGAGSGAVVGGVIGRAAGNTGLGAIIGGAVGGVAGGVIGRRMDKQAKEIEQQVPGAKVDRVGEGIVVEFSNAVLFGTNQSNISSQASNTLNQLITVLNKYPDTNLEIDGHTDNTGADDYNQALSERRANAVAAYLRSNGIASSRITTRGFGESYPKYDNNTESGRAGNRRVEFQITANEKMKQDAAREADGNR
jgi:outer membrane protein OmpA-like peptidoglycan-associated protein